MIKNILYKVSTVSRKIGKNLTVKDREWNQLLKDWSRQDKQKKFRTHYPELNEKSVIFDLGGYKGQWASDMFSQYLCAIHVFEPHPTFAEAIKHRFANNEKVKIYAFGLSAKEEQISLATSADSTSAFIKGNDVVAAMLKDINAFWAEEGIESVDLMKINIEGGEYDVLENLIETGLIKKVKNIQVQFHHFVPHAEKRMIAIQNALSETHGLTYQFTFFWENWVLK